MRRLLGALSHPLIGLTVSFVAISLALAALDRQGALGYQKLEALSTAAGFLAASVAVYFAARALAHERDRDEREQATQVAAWGTFSWKAPDEAGALPTAKVTLHFANSSQLPVNRVVLKMYIVRGDADYWSAGASTAEELHELHVERINHLLPTSLARHEPIEVTLHKFAEIARSQGPPEKWVPVYELSFWDAAGRRWVRSPSGRLSKQRES